MIAELAENAVVFSPPNTPVLISGDVVGPRVRGGDRGPRAGAERGAAGRAERPAGEPAAVRPVRQRPARPVRGQPAGQEAQHPDLPAGLPVRRDHRDRAHPDHPGRHRGELPAGRDGPGHQRAAERPARRPGRHEQLHRGHRRPGRATGRPAAPSRVCRGRGRDDAAERWPASAERWPADSGADPWTAHVAAETWTDAERRGRTARPGSGRRRGDRQRAERVPRASRIPATRKPGRRLSTPGPRSPPGTASLDDGDEDLADSDSLPRRVRQASLAPQLRENTLHGHTATNGDPAAAPAAQEERSPEEARSTITAIQQGWERGRSLFDPPAKATETTTGAEAQPGPGDASPAEPGPAEPSPGERPAIRTMSDGRGSR